jgi:hypothetical protein
LLGDTLSKTTFPIITFAISNGIAVWSMVTRHEYDDGIVFVINRLTMTNRAVKVVENAFYYGDKT